MPKKLGIKGTFRGSMDKDAARVHPRFHHLDTASPDEEVFFFHELPQLGLPRNMSKAYALKMGFMKTGRGTSPGRRFTKAMHYLDRAGLEAVITHFRAYIGKLELEKAERGGRGHWRKRMGEQQGQERSEK